MTDSIQQGQELLKRDATKRVEVTNKQFKPSSAKDQTLIDKINSDVRSKFAGDAHVTQMNQCLQDVMSAALNSMLKNNCNQYNGINSIKPDGNNYDLQLLVDHGREITCKVPKQSINNLSIAMSKLKAYTETLSEAEQHTLASHAQDVLTSLNDEGLKKELAQQVGQAANLKHGDVLTNSNLGSSTKSKLGAAFGAAAPSALGDSSSDSGSMYEYEAKNANSAQEQKAIATAMGWINAMKSGGNILLAVIGMFMLTFINSEHALGDSMTQQQNNLNSASDISNYMTVMKQYMDSFNGLGALIDHSVPGGKSSFSLSDFLSFQAYERDPDHTSKPAKYDDFKSQLDNNTTMQNNWSSFKDAQNQMVNMNANDSYFSPDGSGISNLNWGQNGGLEKVQGKDYYRFVASDGTVYYTKDLGAFFNGDTSKIFTSDSFTTTVSSDQFVQKIAGDDNFSKAFLTLSVNHEDQNLLSANVINKNDIITVGDGPYTLGNVPAMFSIDKMTSAKSNFEQASQSFLTQVQSMVAFLQTLTPVISASINAIVQTIPR